MIQAEPEYWDRSNLEPEQELAVAVIAQAFDDLRKFYAMGPIPTDSKERTKWHTRRLDAYDAARFLLGGEQLNQWTWPCATFRT